VRKPLKQQDFELIRLAKQGDHRAYNQIIKNYQHAVFNLINRMVHNKKETEDLTQETFIKVFHSLPAFNEEYAFTTWLYKIATNNCIDFFRKRKLQTCSIDKPLEYKNSEIHYELPDPEMDAEKNIIALEKSKVIREAIASLPKKYLRVIQLRHQEEKSYEEIAQILHLPLGTIKARIFRAREILNKALKDRLY
jgi:RNA polymerase sigma-70 factor (ECF subfamily)